MRKLCGRLMLSGWLMLVLLVGIESDNMALASGHSLYWNPAGYTLQGHTNQPIDVRPIPYRPQTQYQTASFAQTPNGGVWVGVGQEMGDFCQGSSYGRFPKVETNPYAWAYDQPNVWVQRMYGWITGEDCTSIGTHVYQARGWHNIHTDGPGVDFWGDTNVRQ